MLYALGVVTTEMVDGESFQFEVSDLDTRDGPAMVRVDAISNFSELVTRLGKDPGALLAKAQIHPAALGNRHALIPYRALGKLLERAAVELACPDFGMRLAATQGGIKILGPLQYAMRNSRTLRDAFRYSLEHVQVYSTAGQMRFEQAPAQGNACLRIEIPLAKSDHPQTVERALLLAQESALIISGGQVRAHEVWLTHGAISAPCTYREYFGANVRFERPMNCLIFADLDLDLPIPNTDSRLYELATNFIENRFPCTDSVFCPRIRIIVERLLLAGNCTHSSVASMLGMHPRTLQRCLRAEGASFEEIKDAVRREIALRYLRQSTIPLIQLAKLLGYADTSRLSRSCQRWFSASPRQLRDRKGELAAQVDYANRS